MDDVPARLIVKRGPKSGQEFELLEDEITIGRSSTSAITIADPQVSRHHACIRRDKSSYIVEDWTSTNGTFVNGQRIKGSVTLYNADKIRLGDRVLLQFEADDPRFQRTDWGQPVSDFLEEEDIEKVQADRINDPESGDNHSTVTADRPPDPTSVPEQKAERRRLRRWLLGCGCSFLILVILCVATVFFLDSFQEGRLLYCGPIRPLFEIVLGPFGFAPICP